MGSLLGALRHDDRSQANKTSNSMLFKKEVRLNTSTPSENSKPSRGDIQSCVQATALSPPAE